MTGTRFAHLVEFAVDQPRRAAPYLALEHLEGWTGRLVSGVELDERSPADAGQAAVREGDVLFGKLRPYLAKSYVANRDLLASTELMCFRPVDDIDSRWLGYLVRSQPFVEWSVPSSEGTKMPRTSWEKLRDYRATVPSVEQQRSIADYLDTETAHIDALISKKHRIVELIEERWRAAVDEFTRSGEPVRVRFVTSLRTSGPRGWGDFVGDVGVPFIRSANLRRDRVSLNEENLGRVEVPSTSEAQRSRVSAGDTVIGITGANTGWVGQVSSGFSGGYVSQHVAILRPVGIDPHWLTYSLFAPRAQDQLLGGQYGGTKTQLGLNDLAELEIRVPSEETQRRLIDQLLASDRCRTSLARSIKNQIELLGEHRQALITAAVTGELQIPGVAA